MLAGDVAAYCRTIGETASNKTLWIEGASLIERTFGGQASWQELHERASSFSLDEQEMLHLLGELGATVQGGVPLKEAWLAHKSILDRLGYDRSALLSGSYRQIILPFLTLYWMNAFEQQKFRFSVPRLIEQELQELQSAPQRNRAQMLLSVVARGLGISVSQSRQ